MANIKEFLDRIASAIYGEEVRSSIINALDQINSAATDSAASAANAASAAVENASAAASSASNAATSKTEAAASAAAAEAAANRAEAASGVSVATTQKAGIVKPDGTTITVDANGSISVGEAVTGEISSVKNDLVNHNHDDDYASKDDLKNYSKASAELSLIIPASGWTGEEAPYTNTISVTGATADNNIEVIVPPTATADEITAFVSAMILNGTQANGSITLNCWGTVPEIDLPVTVIVRGD